MIRLAVKIHISKRKGFQFALFDQRLIIALPSKSASTLINNSTFGCLTDNEKHAVISRDRLMTTATVEHTREKSDAGARALFRPKDEDLFREGGKR